MPPPPLKPMSSFDPSMPALLHDQLNDAMVPWTGEQAEHWRQHTSAYRGNMIEWDGSLYDGWCEPLGG